MPKLLALLFAMSACLPALAAEGPWDASLSSYGRLAGETDDHGRLQRAVDAAPFGVVYVPKGEYRIAAPVVVTNFCSLLLHKGAVLKATREMPYVLKVNGAALLKEKWPIRDYNAFLKGGCIDGNGLASCLALDGFWHFTMRDVTFLNGRRHGVRVHGEAGGYELVAENLYFKCLMRGLAGNVALESTGGDSHYTDCIVVDYTVGFKVGGGNRLTRCHVWGGPIPPARPGEDREMLKDSICYWICGGDKTALRDCYADTGKIGFRIDGHAQLLGCWYFNNPCFKMDGVTIVEHRGGRLLVADGWFYKDSPNVTVYRATHPDARAEWRNMTYIRFGEEEEKGLLPGRLGYPADPKWDADQSVRCADDWEYLQQGPYAFTATGGAYADGKGCTAESRYVSTRFLRRRFPDCGPGRELVVRARATTPDTKGVELAIREKDGKTWGTVLDLTQEWRDIRVPLAKLRYFSHWGGTPPFREGWAPDRRRFASLRFCFEAWLCPKATDKAHGFEVSSVKVVQ